MLRLLSLSIAVIFVPALLSCGSAPEKPTEPASNQGQGQSRESEQVPEAKSQDGSGASETVLCYNVDTSPKALLKSQTFAIDFEPFKRSCFVTSHDAEFKDPPLDAEIAIYKDGAKVFTFPDQFNGVTTGCWVDAVSFQDLNRDRLTDIIVVGQCSAKTAPYNENVVYLNDTKSFITLPNGNDRLSDFATIKDIVAFLKENPEFLSLNADDSTSNSKP